MKHLLAILIMGLLLTSTVCAYGGYHGHHNHGQQPGYGSSYGQNYGKLPHFVIRERRQWMRSLDDVKQMLRDGRVRMAQRQLKHLTRQVLNGSGSPRFNRKLVRRLSFISQDLQGYYGDINQVIHQLREVKNDIRRSLRR